MRSSVKPRKNHKTIKPQQIQVVPKAKLEVLQKVFDKVYKQKRNVGT